MAKNTEGKPEARRLQPGESPDHVVDFAAAVDPGPASVPSSGTAGVPSEKLDAQTFAILTDPSKRRLIDDALAQPGVSMDDKERLTAIRSGHIQLAQLDPATVGRLLALMATDPASTGEALASAAQEAPVTKDAAGVPVHQHSPAEKAALQTPPPQALGARPGLTAEQQHESERARIISSIADKVQKGQQDLGALDGWIKDHVRVELDKRSAESVRPAPYDQGVAAVAPEVLRALTDAEADWLVGRVRWMFQKEISPYEFREAFGAGLQADPADPDAARAFVRIFFQGITLSK